MKPRKSQVFIEFKESSVHVLDGAEGAEFVGDTPEEFTAFVRSEIDKWGRAVKASGAKVD